MENKLRKIIQQEMRKLKLEGTYKKKTGSSMKPLAAIVKQYLQHFQKYYEDNTDDTEDISSMIVAVDKFKLILQHELKKNS